MFKKIIVILFIFYVNIYAMNLESVYTKSNDLFFSEKSNIVSSNNIYYNFNTYRYNKITYNYYILNLDYNNYNFFISGLNYDSLNSFMVSGKYKFIGLNIFNNKKNLNYYFNLNKQFNFVYTGLSFNFNFVSLNIRKNLIGIENRYFYFYLNNKLNISFEELKFNLNSKLKLFIFKLNLNMVYSIIDNKLKIKGKYFLNAEKNDVGINFSVGKTTYNIFEDKMYDILNWNIGLYLKI